MRVTIFDRIDDGRLVFRAESDFRTVMPEHDDASEEALESLDCTGSALVGGGAAPAVLLIRTGTDAEREARILRRQIANRAIRTIRQQGPSPVDTRDLLNALAQAEDEGCRLRLRDLAAADDADVAHDVMGIFNHRHRVTGRVDLAVFRPRFLDVADGEA